MHYDLNCLITLLIVIIRENSNPRTVLAEPTVYEEMTLEQPGDLHITDPIQGEFLKCSKVQTFKIILIITNPMALMYRCWLSSNTFGMGSKALRLFERVQIYILFLFYFFPVNHCR